MGRCVDQLKTTLLLAATLVTFTACLSIWAHAQHATELNVRLCPRGYRGNSTQSLATFGSRSLIDCAVQCLRSGRCASFNYSPQRVEEEGEEAIICHNGGTFDGTGCQCLPQYAGPTCHRYIADCTELREKAGSHSGPFLIQPTRAPQPFWVQCIVDTVSSFTWVFSRHRQLFQNVSWAQARHGHLGDLLTASYSPLDFFIGLENLGYLTSQDHYINYVQLLGDNLHVENFRINNLTVGPESQAYPLNYTSILEANDLTLPETGPLVFGTRDHDTNGCANGACSQGAGWFSEDCSSFGLFADAGTSIRIGGVWTKLYFGNMLLSRASDIWG